MIEVYASIDALAFEWAEYHAKNKEQSLPIRVAREEEKAKSFATLAQNIAINDATLSLRTKYNYDYKPQEHIRYRRKWYEITNIREIEKNRAPQVLMFAPSQIARETILQLKEVEW